MIDKENMNGKELPEKLCEVIDDFFTFAEENGISYWDRRDWEIERYSGYVKTLFLRPLFKGHNRAEHIQEFEMANDFINEKMQDKHIQIGFFKSKASDIMTKEERMLSREDLSKESIEY